MLDKLILVVEDNPDHLELTVLTLEESGIRAEIAVARDGVRRWITCSGKASMRAVIPKGSPRLFCST